MKRIKKLLMMQKKKIEDIFADLKTWIKETAIQKK